MKESTFKYEANMKASALTAKPQPTEAEEPKAEVEKQPITVTLQDITFLTPALVTFTRSDIGKVTSFVLIDQRTKKVRSLAEFNNSDQTVDIVVETEILRALGINRVGDQLPIPVEKVNDFINRKVDTEKAVSDVRSKTQLEVGSTGS